ncbi:hypothetical protein EDB83DRAFT_2372541 [Lactarius deliciosus]|nr:hypothetical protein EDB83DRAFT_2372541 [Lactarius deliciosus]
MTTSSNSGETSTHGMRNRGRLCIWRRRRCRRHLVILDRVRLLHLASSSPSALSNGVVRTSILNGGGYDAVRTLILNGADVSARGEGRRTPLHLASSSPNDVVQTLILNGADVNAQDGSHLTPCIWRRCR